MSSGSLLPVIRPDGRLYRPRKVAACAVVDDNEALCGVIVFGTHNVGWARELAREYVRWQLGSGYVAVDPETGWWRDAFSFGHRVWMPDPVTGRAAVKFGDITETAAREEQGA